MRIVSFSRHFGRGWIWLGDLGTSHWTGSLPLFSVPPDPYHSHGRKCHLCADDSLLGPPVSDSLLSKTYTLSCLKPPPFEYLTGITNLLRITHCLIELDCPSHPFQEIMPNAVSTQFSCQILRSHSWHSHSYMRAITDPCPFFLHDVLPIWPHQLGPNHCHLDHNNRLFFNSLFLLWNIACTHTHSILYKRRI